MRIETFHRVVYEHNPLAEVVCQVRFEQIGDLAEPELAALREAFSVAGYPNHGTEVSFGFSLKLATQSASTEVPAVLPQVRIHHFASADNLWRASLCSQFIALTCLKYSSWNDFLPRLLAVARTFTSKRTEATPTRVGLRYKDVIERESIGLNGVPWHELIAPFLLGPLAPDALAEGQTAADIDISSFGSQSLLRLDDSMLLLQSSLLASLDGQRHAFLIDADFYNEEGISPELLLEPEILSARLEALHANAGALFQRGITRRLHHALRPIA